jgi:glycosyltransferase involved in cell wall biosynthesis
VSATARPAIEPVEGSHRPFWSVMMPTFNGDPRLVAALESVLAQAPGQDEMQIEVVDDRSSRGDPGALVERVGRGRVTYYQQPTNVGHSANFNTCIRRARGEIVHILHDDDAVLPGFYARLETALRGRPEVGAAFTRSIYADADGHWQSFSPVERPTPGIVEDWLFRIASGQRVTTPSVVVRRSAYEAIGGFDQSVSTGGEDWEMWVRIATRFPVWFEPEPLAVYRMNRTGSLTGAAEGTVGLAQDMLRMTAVVESYLAHHLDTERAAQALRRSRNLYGRWAIEAAWNLTRGGRRDDAMQAYRLSWSASEPRAFFRSLARTVSRVRRS